MKRDAEELRAKGEEYFAPLSVRRAERDVKEYDFRRPGEKEPKTLTTLKDERKRGRIEYDMANFKYPDVCPREYPRYSDRDDIPFWVNDKADRPRSGAISSSSKIMHAVPRSYSEPVLKVNQIPWSHESRESVSDYPSAAHASAASYQAPPVMEYGSKTKKRYTSALIEAGAGRNKPRIFDDIQLVRVGPKDLEHLDLSSSFEPIKNNALIKQAEERKKSAVNPRCSRLWNEHTVQSSIEEPPSRGSDGKNASATQMRERSVSGFSTGQTATIESVQQSNSFGPKSYATLEKSMGTREGVRCGGFQKLDWVPPHPSPLPMKSTRGSKTPTRDRADSGVSG